MQAADLVLQQLLSLLSNYGTAYIQSIIYPGEKHINQLIKVWAPFEAPFTFQRADSMLYTRRIKITAIIKLKGFHV